MTSRSISNNYDSTFKDPAALATGDPDPRLGMPLAVGDYITYSATQIGNSYAVYALTANIGAYTAPGSKPAYVTVESAIYAVVTTQPNGVIAETRAVAFTTDPSSIMTWSAQDIDPCTGAVTERPILQVQPNPAVPKGRAIFRLGKTDVSPATKQTVFRMSQGTVAGAGGVIAGQFGMLDPTDLDGLSADSKNSSTHFHLQLPGIRCIRCQSAPQPLRSYPIPRQRYRPLCPGQPSHATSGNTDNRGPALPMAGSGRSCYNKLSRHTSASSHSRSCPSPRPSSRTQPGYCHHHLSCPRPGETRSHYRHGVSPDQQPPSYAYSTCHC